MITTQQIMTGPKSTSRLRNLRNAALAAIGEFKPPRFCMIEKVTLHFFNDCCIVFGAYEQGHVGLPAGETLHKSFAVYSRDLKEWKEYKDQFEPAEGYHHAYQYKPHDASFPTSEW